MVEVDYPLCFDTCFDVMICFMNNHSPGDRHEKGLMVISVVCYVKIYDEQ